MRKYLNLVRKISGHCCVFEAVKKCVEVRECAIGCESFEVFNAAVESEKCAQYLNLVRKISGFWVFWPFWSLLCV